MIKCICVHAPEQHGDEGCFMVSVMSGPCKCPWDGGREAMAELTRMGEEDFPEGYGESGPLDCDHPDATGEGK